MLTEAGSAAHGPVHLAMLLRYGPRGHGLVGYDEYGLHTLDAPAVQAWAHERFTAGNAAIWMTGRPPKHLPFELRAGERLAPPEPDAIPYVRFPTVHSDGPPGGATVAYEARRSYALAVGMSTAETRARERLRFREGASYDITWRTRG